MIAVTAHPFLTHLTRQKQTIASAFRIFHIKSTYLLFIFKDNILGVKSEKDVFLLRTPTFSMRMRVPLGEDQYWSVKHKLRRVKPDFRETCLYEFVSVMRVFSGKEKKSIFSLAF